MASSPAASAARGPTSTVAAGGSALSATSCHDTSPGTATAFRAALNTPAPGRVMTSPSATSVEIALDTVTGLTWYCVTNARLGGSFWPSE